MILRALRSRKSARVMHALNVLAAAAVMSGVPITAEVLAGWLVVAAVFYELVVGAPRAGEDGDPETPL